VHIRRDLRACKRDLILYDIPQLGVHRHIYLRVKEALHHMIGVHRHLDLRVKEALHHMISPN